MTAATSPRRETQGDLADQAISLPATKVAALSRAALFEAQRNLGQTWPNPSVGAVVADAHSGEILGSAVTAQGGRPHAEVLALNEAGARARGALLFTTLEPCSHHGRTPPCADAIIKAGIASVVYGSVDPDPRVSGRGLARLGAHGIGSILAPFSNETNWLNLGHRLRVTAKRPFVQLKLAVDIAGFIAAGDGKPVWVTGEEARAAAHLLRAQVDAVLVGRGTINADNPELTCRLPGMDSRSPIRVVVTTNPQLPPDGHLMREPQPPVWLIHGQVSKAQQIYPNGIKPFAVKGYDGKPDIRVVLTQLAAEGITRLLVEGGPTMARAILDARTVDEIVIFRGAQRSGGLLLPFGDQGLTWIERSPNYVAVSERRVGADTETVYRHRAHWQV